MQIVARLVCVALAAGVCAAPAVAQSVAAQSSIVGTVFDSLRTRAPLANATVVLVEKSRYVTTDARGRFRIDSVADGRYTLGFVHPVLDSLDFQMPAVAVDVVAGRRAAIALSTPSPSTAYSRLCPGVRESETGVIVGLVRDVDDRSPLADVVVSTEWTEFTVTNGRSVGQRVRTQAQTSADGLYLLCNVPIDTPIDVRSDFAGFVAGPASALLDARLIGRIDLAISRRDSASMTVVDSASRHTNTLGTASLRGRVRLADGKPAKSVIVAVGGTSRSTRTDSVGAFLLAGVPAGTRTIEVRGVGAVPFTTTVHFATNEMRDTTLQLQRVAQELKAVEVKGKAGLSSLMKQSGFEDRRRMGLGAFLTDSDLAKHEYPDLRSVLAVARGIRLEYGPGGSAMPYMRNASGLRIPTFFLDGAHFPVDGPVPPSRYPFSDLSDLVRPERIRGIEVYSSLGTIPLEYDRNAVGTCGAVVIWTR